MGKDGGRKEKSSEGSLKCQLGSEEWRTLSGVTTQPEKIREMERIRGTEFELFNFSCEEGRWRMLQTAYLAWHGFSCFLHLVVKVKRLPIAIVLNIFFSIHSECVY